ncbi:LysR family transcriptional regulator [Flexivirga sp. ID2601S]|uniref:LysR family transcriptional regulator n=1 Tax=Flexivirga aerilata TaxID=1656889 RepID=A0A849ADT5_9MICO|nr:LysR family transcriptional regulator [Flexivirga aerilata]NNG37726.1 LysR family transcriptional regulator [Flexivirga aerilata]
MDLKQLRYFDTVAQTCHFGQAAERLHVAQPALSQAIRRLEADLGVELLTRTTRSVQLTPAGEFFHREVTRLLRELDASVAGARSIAGGRSGLLRIGFTGTSAYTQMSRLARLVRSALPAVAVEVQTDLLTPRQTELLGDGRLDLGVLRAPVDDDGIRTRHLLDEPLILALPADHRLVPESGLELGDVATDDFVTYTDTRSVVYEAMVASCRDAGFSPTIAHRAPSTAASLALVAAGLGITLVPDSVRSMQLDGVVFREVQGAASIDLSLAWRADNPSALVRSVLATLDSHDFFSGADPSKAEDLT